MLFRSVHVLIDSERNTEFEPLDATHQGFFEICSSLFGAENVFLTKRRATENYLSDRAVKVVKGDKCRALDHYEKLDSIEPSWGKNENWMIAEEMNSAEINNTDVGEFLLKLQKRVIQARAH